MWRTGINEDGFDYEKKTIFFTRKKLELLFERTCMLEILVTTEFSLRFFLKKNKKRNFITDTFNKTKEFVSQQSSPPGDMIGCLKIRWHWGFLCYWHFVLLLCHLRKLFFLSNFYFTHEIDKPWDNVSACFSFWQ